MTTTEYTIHSHISNRITIALVSDLHNRPSDGICRSVKERKPDIIAIPGDLINSRTGLYDNGLTFLKCASSVAPTFYSLGNHEADLNNKIKADIRASGAVLLDNSSVKLDGITVGGLSSGFVKGAGQGHFVSTPEPDLEWLRSFSENDGFKLLLCHHPEYYSRYIADLPIELTLSGHAHGGQIRLFGRGLFAPGQGFFPKYTSGVYDGRLVVSRGLSNTAGLIPRVFNNTEIIYITVTG